MIRGMSAKLEFSGGVHGIESGDWKSYPEESTGCSFRECLLSSPRAAGRGDAVGFFGREAAGGIVGLETVLRGGDGCLGSAVTGVEWMPSSRSGSVGRSGRCGWSIGLAVVTLSKFSETEMIAGESVESKGDFGTMSKIDLNRKIVFPALIVSSDLSRTRSFTRLPLRKVPCLLSKSVK